MRSEGRPRSADDLVLRPATGVFAATATSVAIAAFLAAVTTRWIHWLPLLVVASLIAVRGLRVSVQIGADGICVRNSWRTYRWGWEEVESVEDEGLTWTSPLAFISPAGFMPALRVRTTSGRTIHLQASLGKEATRRVLAAVRRLMPEEPKPRIRTSSRLRD